MIQELKEVKTWEIRLAVDRRGRGKDGKLRCDF